jgi:hypothetical protein
MKPVTTTPLAWNGFVLSLFERHSKRSGLALIPPPVMQSSPTPSEPAQRS